MSSLFIIQLQQIKLYGQHGMYEEEKKVGNEFAIDITITLKAPKEKISKLNQTINYAEVFRITKEIFLTRSQLLESLAIDITEAIKEQFSICKKITVKISKLHPPITGFTGSVSVSYEKSYKL